MKETRISSPEKPLGNTAVMLGLTYRCQCKCDHCGVDLQRKKNKPELTNENVLNIIDDCARLGVWVIYFFGGEPLIVPEITDYIKYAADRGIRACLDTNGFLLDENMVKRLKDSGTILVRVSIDSPYEQEHDSLRGVKGIFRKAVNGLDLCRAYKIETSVSAYATKKNLKNGDLQKIILLAKENGAKVRLLSSICSGKWENKENVALSNDEIQTLKSLLEKDLVSWERLDSKDQAFRCHATMKELVHITPYGDVQPCCFFHAVAGNIHEEPLGIIVKRMWLSSLFDSPYMGDCPANSKEFVNKYIM